MEPDGKLIKQDLLAWLRHLLLRMPEGIDIPGARFFRCGNNAYRNCCVDRPLLSLTVQGRKEIHVGSQELELKPGVVFASCVDMPSNSAILEASPLTPYLSLSIYLERKILADILAEMRPGTSEAALPGAGAWTMVADARMVGAFFRLASLAEHPEDIPVLAPLIQRELHFLALASPYGARMRHLYTRGARDGRIVDVIAWFKLNVASQTNMEDLARMAHMSVSSFHRHFKAITGLSPLQYHKKLKLHEAQRLMLAENERVSEAAMAVGYESISQFNREYRRMFGEAPRKDISNKLEKLARG